MLVNLAESILVLKAGHVIGMPTETVYGLAGRVDSESAIQEIFRTKQRPFFDPLIVHVANIDQGRSLVASWPKIADVLAQAFWPGPLTLVLPKSDKVSSLITSGLDSVGLRCPDHDLTRKLIAEVGTPLAAPSANMFGKTSPTCAMDVESAFSGKVPVLDGGSCQVGVESTVLLIQTAAHGSTLSILRPGMISASQIEQQLKKTSEVWTWQKSVGQAQAPGQMKHHYMPEKVFVYCKYEPKDLSSFKSWILAGLGQLPDQVEGVQLKKTAQISQISQFHLSPDHRFAARELYQRLREASSNPGEVIYFVEPPEYRDPTLREQWEPIHDRLSKAATLKFGFDQ